MSNIKHNIEYKIAEYCNDHRALLLHNLIEGEEMLLQAPASSSLQYHDAYPGGLLAHISKVIAHGEKLGQDHDVSKQSIVTVAVLHDLRKIGDTAGCSYYQPNILKSGKQSEAKPYEINKTNYLKTDGNDEEINYLVNNFGKWTDGEASLAYVYARHRELYNDLTPDEIQAIQYHDLGYGKAKYEIAGKECPLTIIMHAADMLASRENKNDHRKD